MALRNYLGGSVENPCPEGNTPFKWFGSDYCNAADYEAWKLRIQRMWKVAIEPTWNEYIRSGAAVMDGDEVSDKDPMWERVERFRNAYNQLPAPSFWMGFQAAAANTQTAIAIGQDGEQTLELLQARIREAGGEPPATPEGPKAKLPGKSPLGPWLWGLGIGAGVVGGIALGVYLTRD